MTGILPEAYELVEDELVSDADFRDFVFGNPVRFYTRLNPDFFPGTRVEAEAAKLVAETRPPGQRRRGRAASGSRASRGGPRARRGR
jgi:hypothetical protein